MPDQIIYTLLENNPEFNTQGGSDTNKKKLNRSRFDKGAIRIAGHFVPTKPKGYIIDSDYIRDCYTGKPLSDTIDDVQEAAVASQEQLNSMLEDGKIKSDYLPSYVDDVVEYPTLADFPEEGESGKIYIDLSTGNSYRWSGSEYFPFSESSLRVVFSMSYPYIKVSDCSATHAEIKAAVDDGKFVYGYNQRYGSLVLKECDGVRATFGIWDHSTQDGGFLTIVQIDISNSDTYDVSFAYVPTYTYINTSRINKLTASEFNTLVTNETLHAGDFYEVTDDGNKLYYATVYNAYKELTDTREGLPVIKLKTDPNNTSHILIDDPQGFDLLDTILNKSILIDYDNKVFIGYLTLNGMVYVIRYTEPLQATFNTYIITGFRNNGYLSKGASYNLLLGYASAKTEQEITTMKNQYKLEYCCLYYTYDTYKLYFAKNQNITAEIPLSPYAKAQDISNTDLATAISGSTLVPYQYYYETTNAKLLMATSTNTLIEITTTPYTPQP